MNVVVVFVKMEEYALMEWMRIFVFVSLVFLERIVKWILMIVINYYVIMEVGLLYSLLYFCKLELIFYLIEEILFRLEIFYKILY